ncbi:MAG: PsiF family protein [Tahibacter sp.]
MNSIRTLVSAVLVSLVAASSGVVAAETKPAKAPTAQQQRMTDCNQQATGKKGDERKAFMSSCLKGETVAAHKPTQQEKMKSCNTDAAGKKGDERKAFMSNCLKGDGAAPAAH